MPATRLFRKLVPASLGPGHALFTVVFLVRLLVLMRLASSPFLLPSGSDMHFYDEWAKQILDGRFTDHLAFYGLPLYAYLLAFLYKIFGYTPFVPGLIQAILEAGTAALIYQIADRTLQRVRPRAQNESEVASASPKLCVAGLLAGTGWAFFVPAQAYSVILMPTSWFVFVFWFVVWQLVKMDRAPSPLRSLGFGLVIGMTAMGVATVLFLIPLVLAAILLRPLIPESHSRMRARGVAVALLLVGVGAGSAPCWIHNSFVARDSVFLSAHGGINLWLGNNPDATGYPRFPGLHAGQGAMLRDSIDLAEAAAGRTLKRSEVSQYWARKARAYIAENPIAWLTLMARKVGNFWNAFEYDDLGIIANLRENRILFPGLHFALVAALALPGFFFSRPFPASRWIAAAIFLQMAAVLPIFVTERYRLPVVPGLLIFAGLSLQQLWSFCSLAEFRKLGSYFLILAAGAFLITLPRHDPALWAMEAYNSGRLALETNNLPLAKEKLDRARSLVPENPEINFALGNLYLEQADPVRAKAFYDAALKTDATHKGALNNLGVIALEENHPGAAAEYFRRALAQEPRNAKTHYLLAKALAGLGDLAGARTEAARALELGPDQPEFKIFRDKISNN